MQSITEKQLNKEINVSAKIVLQMELTFIGIFRNYVGIKYKCRLNTQVIAFH